MAPRRGSTTLAVLLLVAAIALAACGRARATGPIETVSSTAVLLSDADVQTLAALLEAADTRRADTTGIDQALSSTTPFVRAFAARTVGQIGISDRAARLRALVADPDSMIAADAAFSLGLLRDSVGVGALASGLARQPTVIAAAASSLGELADSARSAIEQVLRTGQPKAALSDVARRGYYKGLAFHRVVPNSSHRTETRAVTEAAGRGTRFAMSSTAGGTIAAR